MRYGGKHQATRRAMLPYAYGSPCVRCGRPMLPGQSLHLDHEDDGVATEGSPTRCATRPRAGGSVVPGNWRGEGGCSCR
jgi:hypothetical protein